MEQLWYGIPVDKAPKIIREKIPPKIAFYFPDVFMFTKNICSRFREQTKIMNTYRILRFAI